MLDPRLLKTFLAAAAALSFRKAADAVHCSPSTVTSHIKALEESLGETLFDRVGRRVLLTEHGRRLLPHAQRLLDVEAETRRAVSRAEDDSGELCVRLSESLGVHCLPALLPRFRAAFPNTRLRLSTSSRHGLARDLRHGLVDLALVLGEPFVAPGLRVETLHREPVMVIAPPDSPLASLSSANPADLRDQPLLLTPHVWSVRPAIERALAEASVVSPGIVECTSVEVVKRCVMAGHGVSFAPRFTVAEEAARGRLAALPWGAGPLSASVLLVRDADRAPSPAAAAFIAAAREFFEKEASGGQGLCPWTPLGG